METSGKKSSSKKKSVTRKKSSDSKERKNSDAGLDIKNRARVYPNHVENVSKDFIRTILFLGCHI